MLLALDGPVAGMRCAPWLFVFYYAGSAVRKHRAQGAWLA